jgi:hypothetical protein
MFVLVTGSRSWTNREKVREVFSELPSDFRLMHGGAKGLDTIAGEVYTEMTGREAEVVRPDYDSYHWKAAPKKRNLEMVLVAKAEQVLGNEVLVIAFKDTSSTTNGTNHCRDAAEIQGLPTKTYFG